MSIAGTVFFEGEDTVKVNKMLYKENPLITVELYQKGNSKVMKTLSLPISHLFEFDGLMRGITYELVFKSGKPMVDMRHESTFTHLVESPDDDVFVKAIIPLRGKTQQ